MSEPAPRPRRSTPAKPTKPAQPRKRKGRGAPGWSRPHPDEQEARRAEVERLLLLGKTVWTVSRECAELWDVTSRSVEGLVLQVRRQWAAEHKGRAQTELDAVRQEHRSRMAMILEAAVGKGQLKTALNAAKLLAELDGLLSARAPQQTDADARHSEDVRLWVDQTAERVRQYGGSDALLAADAKLVGGVQVEEPEPDGQAEADADA